MGRGAKRVGHMSGLLDDSFQFTNANPEQAAKWTESSCNIAWTMFVDGAAFSQIAKHVGKNIKAVRRQIENQIDNFHRHSDTHYQGLDRTSKEWSLRDVWILDRILRNVGGIGVYEMARLLGRSVESVIAKAEQKGRRYD